MNPQTTQSQVGFEALPTLPEAPQVAIPEGAAAVPPAPEAGENTLSNGELPSAMPAPDPAALPAVPATAAPVLPPPVAAVATDDGDATDSPAIADDGDLIEPEWVERAKRIVDATHDDPHRQNQEVNRLKADYIKKRYKKEIKVAEE